MGCALCFAELSTMVKESGGSWAYVRVGLGGAPAFLGALMMMVASASSFALLSKVSAEYILTPFVGECSLPVSLYSVTWTTLYV